MHEGEQRRGDTKGGEVALQGEKHELVRYRRIGSLREKKWRWKRRLLWEEAAAEEEAGAEAPFQWSRPIASVKSCCHQRPP